MMIRRGLGLCLSLMLLSGCASTTLTESQTVIRETDVWVPSRDTKIPATLMVPVGVDGPLPLVLLIHGHGGTRHEAGGFTRVAEGLAEQGIASIRMDFPGCGDSKESFANNNLTNMLADVRAAEAYAADAIDVDPARTGLIGFSMGARLASLLSAADSRFQVMALWAPSVTADEQHMVRYLGGPERWEAMKADASANGYAEFTTFWGQEQKLGPGWFADLESHDALAALQAFEGALLVLYGDADQVIDPAHMAELPSHAREAKIVEHVVIAEALHGLGLFSERPDQVDKVVNETVEFVAREL